MYQPPNTTDFLIGLQKHQIAGLLYIGNFPAAEQEITKALNNNVKPSVAIVCCTITYQADSDRFRIIRQNVENGKNEDKLLHLDIGYGDCPPPDADRAKKENRVSQDQLLEYFQRAFQFIDNAIRNNIPVLVHCDAGASRSASLIVAYLMRAGLTLAEAEDLVRTKRGCAITFDSNTQEPIKFSAANIGNFRSFLEKNAPQFQNTIVSTITSTLAATSQHTRTTDLGTVIEPIENVTAISTSMPQSIIKAIKLENNLNKLIINLTNQHKQKFTHYQSIRNLFHTNFQFEENNTARDSAADQNQQTVAEQEHHKLPTNNIKYNQNKLSDMGNLFNHLLKHQYCLDVHKNVTLDKWIFFKDKSTGWQQLIKDIRTDAYTLLENIIADLQKNNHRNSEIIEYLKTQRNNPLFCMHRGNHWYEKFGVTDTVKQIDKLIKQCEDAVTSQVFAKA